MKPETKLQIGENVCQALVVLGIAWTGVVTGYVFVAMTTPPAPGEFVLDYVPEIHMHAMVLNVALPVGLAGLVGCFVSQVLRKKWKPAFLCLAVVSYLVVSVLTVLVWNCMDHLHGEDISLWERQVWWP